MYNLIRKDLKLGVHPAYLLLSVLLGALMLIPGWIYLIVPMYFCWITVPNTFGQFRAQNDLMFTMMMPVTRQNIVGARIAVFAILEVFHLAIAMIYGAISSLLYPNVDTVFFEPNLGLFGLCFVMMGIFNLFLFPLFYKTAYKFGPALLYAITAVMVFAGLAQWIGIQSEAVSDWFNGSGALNMWIRVGILVGGLVIFLAFTMRAYRMSVKRFLLVELQ